MCANSLAKLFEPVQIGHLTVRNRVMMSAMGTCLATEDDFVTDPMIAYYAKRAEGGVGLIVVETTCVDNPTGRAIPNQLCIDEDKYIPGLERLAKAVQSHGAKIAVQLHHAGPSTHFEGGGRKVAPSPIPLLNAPHDVPRELTGSEIKEIVRKFASGARRAREAGFDAVELLCAHGYLLNRFLSPHANHRTDEYGGSLEGRVRIIGEILESIRQEAGAEFPVLCKVPGDDYVDGGITPEESVGICQAMEAMGVKALTVTGGSNEGRISQFGMGFGEAWQVHLAAHVKRHVGIPVAAMGKIRRPEVAAAIVADGKADIAAMGRALLTDPDLVLKAQRNQSDRIRPCIVCHYCLDRIGFAGKPLRCSVNPVVGREGALCVERTDRPRKVLVIGGGPAGMQAAATAASRGHAVVLLEKNHELGGQLPIAAVAPDKDEIQSFVGYLRRELSEGNVEIRLNTDATKEVVSSFNPEVVVVATGALPIIPSMDGMNAGNSITGWDALLDPDQAKGNVVIIGGGMVGCEVGTLLARKGRKVTIVEQLEEIGLDIGPAVRGFEIGKLREAGVVAMTRTVAKGITEAGVLVSNDGRLKVIAADMIVVAVGSKSSREVLEPLEALKVEIVAVGDSVAPRRIVQAVSQGFNAGWYV